MKSTKSLRIIIILLILLTFLLESPIIIHRKTKDHDWPRWRGPNGDGISTETDWDPEALKDGPQIIWETNVGVGFSNVIIKGKYLYTMGNNYKEDIVYCLNAETGEMVWASKRGEAKKPEIQTGTEYATPVIYDYKGTRSAAIFSSRGLYSVDVETGKHQWFYDWAPYWRYCEADPIIFDNKVFISAARDGGSMLLDISGNVPEVIWRNENMENTINTSVLIDGYVYGIDDDIYSSRDKLTCIGIETGEIMWTKALGPVSLTAADGKLIVLNEKGTIYIVEASPSSYKEISSGKIPEQKSHDKWWISPVLLRSKLFCRNNIGDLISIDISK